MDYHVLKKYANRNYQYRELDGIDQDFQRLAPQQYADGVGKPSGSSRPSARKVSNAFCQQDSDSPHKFLTNYFWLWGQFVDHTITLTKTGSEELNISVPKGDIHFDPQNSGSSHIAFNRSVHRGSPHQQINNLSPFVDASMVYGHNKERSDYLREFSAGRMRTSEGGLLPFHDGHLDNAGHNLFAAFIAGDIRCNEHIGLAAMHNLWVREHNYWAKQLAEYNEELTDEEIYQKAKIIVEALLQHITYEEYLPLLLGKCAMPA